MSNASRR